LADHIVASLRIFTVKSRALSKHYMSGMSH
jgi:hypothetical protein